MARRKLVTRNQVLKSIHIKQLRGVRDLDINFVGSPVTGIFGINGSGKTTILQTIMCLYRDKGTENTKMSRFLNTLLPLINGLEVNIVLLWIILTNP